jgi:hypothetical protein
MATVAHPLGRTCVLALAATAPFGEVDAAPEDDATAGGTGNAAETVLGDTWTWRNGAWTRRDVPGPSPRRYAAMAPLGGVLVLFGGDDFDDKPLGDTWTWDGTAWTQLDVTGPSDGKRRLNWLSLRDSPEGSRLRATVRTRRARSGSRRTRDRWPRWEPRT